jgi:fluoroacetyl-CoA thioesterase
MMEKGLKNEIESVVTEDMLACNVKSGTLRVFATPMMIALMEQTCMECVMPYMDEGCGTVGTRVDIEHVASTPLGMKVKCSCELTEVDNRKLTFSVKVEDERGLIGEGTHVRFIVNNERFQKKTDEK